MPFDATMCKNPQWLAPAACAGMQALQDCARALGNELRDSNVAVGMDIDVQVMQAQQHQIGLVPPAQRLGM